MDHSGDTEIVLAAELCTFNSEDDVEMIGQIRSPSTRKCLPGFFPETKCAGASCKGKVQGDLQGSKAECQKQIRKLQTEINFHGNYLKQKQKLLEKLCFEIKAIKQEIQTWELKSEAAVYEEEKVIAVLNQLREEKLKLLERLEEERDLFLLRSVAAREEEANYFWIQIQLRRGAHFSGNDLVLAATNTKRLSRRAQKTKRAVKDLERRIAKTKKEILAATKLKNLKNNEKARALEELTATKDRATSKTEQFRQLAKKIKAGEKYLSSCKTKLKELERNLNQIKSVTKLNEKNNRKCDPRNCSLNENEQRTRLLEVLRTAARLSRSLTKLLNNHRVTSETCPDFGELPHRSVE